MITLLHYHSIPEPGDTLANLWSMLKAESLPPWLWGSGTEMPLTGFIQYFSDLHRHLFLPFFISEDPELNNNMQSCMGMMWVDDMVPNLRAKAHLYFFKRFHRRRGLGLDIPCRQLMDILSEPPFHLQTLYFFTDERAIALKNFAARLGVKYISTLPRYFLDGSASVGYLALGDSDNGQESI